MRKAFSYAINQAEIIEKIGLLGQIPASRPIPPTLAKNSRAFYEWGDPDLARAHFKEGLNELNISQIEPITLYFKTGQAEKRLAQTLQRQWHDVLGVEVKLEQLDGKSLAQHLHNRTYQMALASWIAQFPDSISILERFKDPQNLKNYPGWENQEYTSLIQQSLKSPEKRDLYLEKAEELLAEQMPLAPLYHWSSPTICSSRIENIRYSPCGGILFEHVIIK
jgi:oligopeptide transport system substrate-binding protein